LRRGHGAKDPENDENRNQFNQGEPPLVAGLLQMMSVRKLIHGIPQRHSIQDLPSNEHGQYQQAEPSHY
jgi:hypothetical protein